jgi:hypothetical protein
MLNVRGQCNTSSACLADSIVRCGGDLDEARDWFKRACDSSRGSSDAMLLAAFADFLMDVYGDVDAAAEAYAKAAALVNSRGQVDVLVSCRWWEGGS